MSKFVHASCNVTPFESSTGHGSTNKQWRTIILLMYGGVLAHICEMCQLQIDTRTLPMNHPSAVTSELATRGLASKAKGSKVWGRDK